MESTTNESDISLEWDYEALSFYLQEITSCDWLIKYAPNKKDIQLFAVHDAHYWKEDTSHIHNKYIPRIAIGTTLTVIDGELSIVKGNSSIKPAHIIRAIYHNPSQYNAAKSKKAGIMDYIKRKNRGQNYNLFISYARGRKRVEPEYFVEHFKALLDCSTYNEIKEQYGINTSLIHGWKKGKGTTSTLLLLRLLAACHNILTLPQEIQVMEAMQKLRIDK